MFMNLGDVAAGSTLYCPFPTYNAAGASVTITGLATTDIEIYKNGSTTQRSSDAGYTLLDTDGIDFDGITGIHGFSVDLSDNTDAGFYAAGGVYWLVVASITADSQSVNFGYYFTIDKNNVLRPTTAGRTLDVSSTGAAGIDLNNIELPAGPIPALGILEGSGTASAMQAGSTSSTAVLRSATAFTDDLINNTVIEVTGGTGAGQVRLIVDWVSSTDTATVNPNWTTTPDNTSTYIVRAAPPAPTTAAYMPSVMLGADAVTAAALAADAGTEIGTAVWATTTRILTALDEDTTTLDLDATIRAAVGMSAANLDTQLTTIDDFLDTEVAAIKAKTDQLTFTVANQVDSNALTVDEDEILDDQLTDSVPADGTLPTVRQALYMLTQFMFERSVSGTTLTVRKADGSTSLMSFTLSDATSPVSITRAT